MLPIVSNSSDTQDKDGAAIASQLFETSKTDVLEKWNKGQEAFIQSWLGPMDSRTVDQKKQHDQFVSVIKAYSEENIVAIGLQ